jgi:hypothetical protein
LAREIDADSPDVPLPYRRERAMVMAPTPSAQP